MDNTAYVILLTALFPVAFLLFYIYRKDKVHPEPAKLLVKTFLMGMLSAPLAIVLSLALEVFQWFGFDPATPVGAVVSAFMDAAIPEECAKLFMLWLVLRKNPYFDEKMDGIVYAVFVSMGFAAVENIIYLFSSPEDFVSIGISRALFAVPGHFCDGILMGYFYSLVKFYPQASSRNRVLVLAAPIIAHGVYDSILFVIEVSELLSGILSVIFITFCIQLWKYCSKRIEDHLRRDGVLK